MAGAACALGAAASAGPAEPPGGCTIAQQQAAQNALARFQRTAAASRRSFFRTHRSAKERRAFLRRRRAKLRRLRAAAACTVERLAQPQPFPFYPQAGIPWRDLYFGNFVDLDPGPGVRDWACGAQSYDTHSGEDSLIRSFQEQRIGVPVFAALDGKVVEVQDFQPDENTTETMTPFDNHVTIWHFSGQQETVYGHLRYRSATVRVGDYVVAGEQIGLTGSSGHSSWPHLHFTGRFHGDVFEPFAGPCRPGPSYWVAQPPLPATPYARDFTFSPNPFGGRADPPWDEAVRTGTFAAGLRDVYFRVELAFFDGGSVRMRFLRPDGSVAEDETGPAPLQGARATFVTWHRRLDLDRVGRWRVVLSAGGTVLVDAPFDVVRSATDVRNRPPNPVAVELAPALPTAGDPLQCVVRTSLVSEDPDFGVVRYRYRWSAGGRTLRSVTSAALSDVLERNAAPRGSTVSCRVVPSDGRLDGPPASAAVRLR